MSSPYLHSPTPSHWWSRSKSSSKLTKDRPTDPSALSRTHSPLQADPLVLDQPPKQSSMFGNFASVIRLKPKKNVHPVAIQEPPKAPTPLIIPPSKSSEPYGPLTSRPYSKAVSAVTVTTEDSLELKTPLDVNSTYQKSLVDSDPFAATASVIFSPQEPLPLDQLFIAPDSHVIKDTPASPVLPRTTHKRPYTANSHISRERLASETTASTRRPTVTIRWVTFTSSSQISDHLTFGSQNAVRCANHAAESANAEGVHERCSCTKSGYL